MPEFITWCIEHIERDIEQDGIYRVAANQATVHALRLDVDRGVERTKWKYGNEVHVVCGALKVLFYPFFLVYKLFDLCFLDDFSQKYFFVKH